ncbi:MAG: inner membrane protein [Variibacter sp.]|jgi:membrane protein implicated in regulation of membrane protease activity|nr:inner membrane protein [Variibacter sp.]
MLNYFYSFGVWNWFILAGVLLAIELLAPGTFMLWFGLAAILIGLISLLVEWPWQAQVVAFAACSLLSLLLWRRFSPRVEEEHPQPFLNRRAEGFVGRVFTLDRAIVDGGGAVRIGDTLWQVRGPDTPTGARVRVTGVDGAMLVVDRELQSSS